MTIPDFRRSLVEDYFESSARDPRSFATDRSKLIAQTDLLFDKMTHELRQGLSTSELKYATRAFKVTWAAKKAARPEILVPVPHSLIDAVTTTLSTTDYDWLTPAYLARELRVDEAEVRGALKALDRAVRNPVGASRIERDYYRLSSKPPTWQERLRRLRAIVTFTPLANDTY